MQPEEIGRLKRKEEQGQNNQGERQDAWETKRLSNPVTIMEFVNLMENFIGESHAHAAISEYLAEHEIDEKGMVSEFELPSLKRFVEKTLAGSVGSAAAKAIVLPPTFRIAERREIC